MRRFKEMPMPPGQTLLFSHSVDEALPQQHAVRGFNDVMECLDYSDIINKCSERGCPPYPPKMMVKVLAYAYSKGLRSSRAIEEALKVDVRFIWLVGGLKPDHVSSGYSGRGFPDIVAADGCIILAHLPPPCQDGIACSCAR